MNGPSVTRADAGSGNVKGCGASGVWVVIAHYGDPEPTRATIASLAAGDVVPEHVLVVDNQGGFDCEGAEVLRPAHNIGFTGAAAMGTKRALDGAAAWVWLVNNDATVAADCLSRLLAAAERRPRAGLLSPVIRYEDDGSVWFAGGTVDARTMQTRHLTVPAGTEPYETGYVTGCALLARGGLIAECGPPDTSLFMYYDDVEWSQRARAHGWEVLVVPSATVLHGVPRDGRRRRFTPRAVYFLTRNRLLLAGRSGHARRALPGALAWGGRQLVKALRYGGPLATAGALARGVADGLRGRSGLPPTAAGERQ